MPIRGSSPPHHHHTRSHLVRNSSEAAGVAHRALVCLPFCQCGYSFRRRHWLRFAGTHADHVFRNSCPCDWPRHTSSMPTQKRPAPAAAPVVQSSPASSGRAEQTLRRVLDYVRDHGGRLPSQHADDTKQLYRSFRKLKSKQDLTASATALLKKIEAVQGQAAAEQARAIAGRVALHGGAFGDNASPGAQAARRAYATMVKQKNALTPQRGAAVAAAASCLDHDRRTCGQYWGHCLAHAGSTPSEGPSRPFLSGTRR